LFRNKINIENILGRGRLFPLKEAGWRSEITLAGADSFSSLRDSWGLVSTNGTGFS
jgi:hypothetical protein